MCVFNGVLLGCEKEWKFGSYIIKWNELSIKDKYFIILYLCEI